VLCDYVQGTWSLPVLLSMTGLALDAHVSVSALFLLNASTLARRFVMFVMLTSSMLEPKTHWEYSLNYMSDKTPTKMYSAGDKFSLLTEKLFQCSVCKISRANNTDWRIVKGSSHKQHKVDHKTSELFRVGKIFRIVDDKSEAIMSITHFIKLTKWFT
jgi:hypothetical protein